MNKIKFSHVKITINRNKINKIINILKLENKSSVLARLNSKNITTYINRVVASDQLKLYLAFYKKKIIGYAVVAEKPEYLTSNFKDFKYNFILDLLLNFNFSTIINLIIFSTGIENFLISGKEKKILQNSANLNLLAIDRSFQSKGLGKKFMNFIINDLTSNIKNRILSCETDNNRSKNFYIKKLKFKEIGKKIRFPFFTTVLTKKLNN
tara:strand:- start:4471 stop:5097 length:627 start_codon:yes stop_codon:yes gene_type:complete